MKNKPFFRSFLTLLFALICMGGVSVTAYAQGNDIPTDDSGVIVETEPQPLTPEGNMSLVDDISGEASEDKQFIVVQSKGGNYFYIVIDHAAEGENTVHFLNQVDEADLMAIIGEEETTAPAVCTCTDKCVAGAINTTCSAVMFGSFFMPAVCSAFAAASWRIIARSWSARYLPLLLALRYAP